MNAPKTPSRRTLLKAAGLLSLSATSGCIGSFGLTDMVYSWNRRLGGKWLNAIVFLVLVILPVYGLLLFVDAIILNVIEFWTGSHPVGGRRISELDDGRRVVTSVTDDPDVLRHELQEDGKTVGVIHTRRTDDGRMELLDEHMRVLTSGHVALGRLEVRDRTGEPVLHVDEHQLQSTRDALAGGVAPSTAGRPYLDGKAPAEMVAMRPSGRTAG